ncbi:hypothetical protein G9272_16875 [Streptomyces asoensis]|uniref:Uncharacterized protein n=1 Tax=Streptomyces asoensis TaxID=249586 RepID=A0A6M4WM99_9ACTN|nr:hypothetical protein [Streptomyces asoensis]QJT01777.1 hypothetical protein G9272_16875 [Streptomyces asoensis]
MTPLDIPVYGYVTLGGVTVGLSLLGWDVAQWWAGHKKHFTLKALRQLAPTLACLSYGALLILCAGGIIGGLADWSLWGTNQIGDVGLIWGVGGTSPGVTRSSYVGLTPGGHSVVVIATVILAAVAAKRGWRWDYVRPIGAGISLGLAKSVAGAIGLIVAPTVSWAGDYVAGIA